MIKIYFHNDQEHNPEKVVLYLFSTLKANVQVYMRYCC